MLLKTYRIVGAAIFCAVALAVLPAIASDKATVGDVTFQCELTGGDHDGYKLSAENRGTTDKRCKATCVLKRESGGTETGESILETVRAGLGKNLVTKAGFTYPDDKKKPDKLSNPQITASSCE
jgi:hypothetical protein